MLYLIIITKRKDNMLDFWNAILGLLLFVVGILPLSI